ncbi:MAG: hypothetical protein PHC64_01040 [Candidatus Gastranaerophilales bacterium]|nr:hypothetical protein [Candidatus Gastranaerophilales bacterium]
MLVSFRNNNVNFTSTPLYKIKLPKTDGSGFVDAVVSRLDPNDKIDQDAVKNILGTWAKGIAADICKYFLRPPKESEYHAIELVGDENLAGKIIALSRDDLNACGNLLHLSLLAVKPEVSFQNPQRKIKDVGQALFGFIINIAKESGICLEFVSRANKFYLKVLQKAELYRDSLNSDLEADIYLAKDEICKLAAHWKKDFKPKKFEEGVLA